MKRVLVTGGAGFIGSHLCERLLNEGNEVFCMDNLETGSIRNIETFKEILVSLYSTGCYRANRPPG